MIRPGVVALIVVVGTLFTYSCAQQKNAPPSAHQQEAPASEHQQKKRIPSTARIVCLPEDEGTSAPTEDTHSLEGGVLTRVLTPKVAAQPDGVHLHIDNRLGKDTSYEADDPPGVPYIPYELILGGPAPKGISNSVQQFHPGLAEINCFSLDLNYPNSDYLKIAVGQSGYKSTDLECEKGAKPSVIHIISETSTDHPVDIVEQVRKQYSNVLKEGDVVEGAGYPEATGAPRSVRVVRHGKVVMAKQFFGPDIAQTYCKGEFEVGY